MNDDAANTLTANYHKFPRQGNYVKEPYVCAISGRDPNVLTPKRTEYGKQIRKDYEMGKLKERRKNIQQLEPRTDGISNTITTVQKDNLLIEPKVKELALQVSRMATEAHGYPCGTNVSKDGRIVTYREHDGKSVQEFKVDCEDGTAQTLIKFTSEPCLRK